MPAALAPGSRASAPSWRRGRRGRPGSHYPAISPRRLRSRNLLSGFGGADPSRPHCLLISWFGPCAKSPSGLIWRCRRWSSTCTQRRGRAVAIAGVDGCRGGWLAVIDTENGSLQAPGVFEHFADLLTASPYLRVIAVDIPIGLGERAPWTRECDRQARALLGRRGVCVFPPPIRQVLDVRDHKA